MALAINGELDIKDRSLESKLVSLTLELDGDRLHTDSDNNVSLGSGALDSVTTGSGIQNVAVGVNAGTNLTTGSNNVVMGNLAYSSSAHTTGSRNIILGNNAGNHDNTSYSDTLYIGNGSSESNHLIKGYMGASIDHDNYFGPASENISSGSLGQLWSNVMTRKLNYTDISEFKQLQYYLNQTLTGGTSPTAYGCVISVSADGTYLAVGDFDGGASNLGNVEVWTRSGSTWTRQQTLTGSTSPVSYGASVSLSADATYLAVGDPFGESGNTGNVEIWTRSGSTWTLQQTLTGSSNPSDYGYSVSMSADGTYLAVGDIDGESGNTGNVEIWTRSGSTWTRQQTLTGSTSPADYGRSITISADGTYLAVGDNQGANVEVWTRSGSTWSLQQTLTGSSDPVFYGVSVSMSSDATYLAVGDNLGNASNTGNVEIWTRSGSTWTRQQTLTGSTSPVSYGVSVSLSADATYLAVGDVGGGSGELGNIEIWSRSGSTWTLKQTLTGSTDPTDYGYSVSMSADGTYLIVGDVDGGGSDLGNVEVFTVNSASGVYFDGVNGSPNTIIGNGLSSNTTGTNNIAIGLNALSSNLTGSSNVVIGHSSNLDSGGRTGCVVIGSNAGGGKTVTTADNQLLIQLGNASNPTCGALRTTLLASSATASGQTYTIPVTVQDDSGITRNLYLQLYSAT